MEGQKMTIDTVPILLRREIEAVFIKPFLEAFTKEVGEERTIQILMDVIEQRALDEGHRAAARIGEGKSLEQKVQEAFMYHEEDDALDQVYLSPAPGQYMFKALRCEYCEMYKRIGMQKWGKYLSCNRDDPFIRGLDPNYSFHRTQTLMEGGTCCDSTVIDNAHQGQEG